MHHAVISERAGKKEGRKVKAEAEGSKNNNHTFIHGNLRSR